MANLGTTVMDEYCDYRILCNAYGVGAIDFSNPRWEDHYMELIKRELHFWTTED